MTCGICGRTLVARQRRYCSRRCSGLGISRGLTARGGKLLDAEWRKARGRKAGAAAARSTRRRQAERVEGMTPAEAWRNGYATARTQLRRHYEKWAVAKAQAVLRQAAA